MQIGYNNDVEYRGKTFHIQTEDRGVPSASVESQIFCAGAILDTSIISYQKVLDETDDIDQRIERIRHVMQGSHKKLYKKLFAGDYDELVGLDPADGPAPEVPEDFEPGQDGIPAAALQIEEGNLEAFAAGMEGEEVDLSKIGDALGDEPSEGNAPTMMLSPADVSAASAAVAPAASAAPAAARSNGAPKPAFADYPKTGAIAWRGCDPPRDDLDIVKLVEDFVG